VSDPLAATRELEARLVVAREVAQGHTGIFARVDLPAGTVFTRFLGPDLAWAEVPEAEVVYVNSFAPFEWTVPRTLARFVNHGCEPNAEIRADRDLATLRDVAAGTELTIDYEWADAGLFARFPEHYFWDPRWSFSCRCGSPRCRGRVDRYRPR
jgi:hypothetical protein